MKKKFFIVLMTSVSIITFSQTGNVGINTTLTTNTLTVNGNSSVGTGYATIAAPVNGMLIEGNVGIGTVAPAAKLDINGKIKITDGTQGDGKVLTSDANGVASWQPAPYSNTITGNNNMTQNYTFITPPTNQFVADVPISLNKGTYTLYYYVQYDYLNSNTNAPRSIDPTNSSTLSSTFPRYIYFEFITSSGSATFPSYPWLGGNGPHVIPIINTYQLAAKISQLVIVNQDNTVIRPRYFGIYGYGQIANIATIIAVKM